MLQNKLSNINLISIRCIYHILNLIVKTELTEIDRLQQKVHKVIKYLANPLANRCLELLESYYYVLIVYVLNSKYKIEHLKATIIEVGRYSKSKAEQYVNSIQQKIFLYKTKYTSSQFSISEIESNNSIMHKMALDFLSIQPSTIASKRAFV
ncbi:14996_t:CDS:2 [Cetraspora pellucida]|uniref:14996_t:CDS:1 n=1 Tax=Cetraspora pellucida TaxID=1433469 RepID=A0A9N9CSP8_9GLOM|nr:14996_t:CDS:2 [Cetraspora pellucida]